MDKNSIIFWRLQEVEVPLSDGKTFDDLRSAMNRIKNGDASSIFDFDGLFNFDNEEVINEDYSGSDEYFGISQNGKIVNGYNPGNCRTFDYVDSGTREYQDKFIEYLDKIINRVK